MNLHLSDHVLHNHVITPEVPKYLETKISVSEEPVLSLFQVSFQQFLLKFGMWSDNQTKKRGQGSLFLASLKSR